MTIHYARKGGSMEGEGGGGGIAYRRDRGV